MDLLPRPLAHRHHDGREQTEQRGQAQAVDQQEDGGVDGPAGQDHAERRQESHGAADQKGHEQGVHQLIGSTRSMSRHR